MIAYASRTGTKKTLKLMRDNGWGILICATGEHRCEGFKLHAIDNGAYTAWQAGRAFDECKFLSVLEKYHETAQWFVLPDIVCGGLSSLDFSMRWLGRVSAMGFKCLPLLAVQDGMTVSDISPIVGRDLGIFVGGSTGFKEGTLGMWGRLSAGKGCYLHVGRVNTKRRIRLCHLAGADSFDGTSVIKFPCSMGLIQGARMQSTLPFGEVW